MKLDSVNNTDLLSLCAGLPDQSIDLIACDLPYGTTACAWDEIIPFAPMWSAFKRVIKPRGAIVLTASQPFTSRLVVSNLGWFRYEWVWVKNRGSNFASAKYQPMKEHESALVFAPTPPKYYPQMIERSAGGKSRAGYAINPSNTGKRDSLRGFIDQKVRNIDPDQRLPSSVLKFNTQVGLHPTQKPVALFEYLIRTYTQPGDIVLDPTVGSGTTALAARNTSRRFIVGDTSAEYCEIARERLRTPYMLDMFDTIPTKEDAA